jgi:AbrB family looped-hinge helix DNA binding protein
MENVSTTKMSSKGQVVVPESIRKQLGLKTGDQFVVVGQGDVVIFKMIAKPSIKQFDAVINKARKQARAVGLKRSDIEKTVCRVRAKS